MYEPQPPKVITPFSDEALGLSLGSSSMPSMITPGSGAWPTANLALFYPFRVVVPTPVTKLFWYCGTLGMGDSIDVGIYDSQKNRLCSIGGVSTGGTASDLLVSTLGSPITLMPGRYLLAGVANNTSVTVFRYQSADELIQPNVAVYEQASAYPLPATCTPVISTLASVSMPIIGFTNQGTF